MLIKRKTGESARPRLAALAAGMSSGVLDRRSFLRRSGLVAGGLAAIGAAIRGPCGAPRPGR
jgi:formate dehydrogenase major subunit